MASTLRDPRRSSWPQVGRRWSRCGGGGGGGGVLGTSDGVIPVPEMHHPLEWALPDFVQDQVPLQGPPHRESGLPLYMKVLACLAG